MPADLDTAPAATSLFERLAAIEHDRWAHWQLYVHSRAEQRPDGTLVIPADLVQRWERQIATAYADLTEAEKESDRTEVRGYWPLIEPLIVATSAAREAMARLHEIRQGRWEPNHVAHAQSTVREVLHILRKALDAPAPTPKETDPELTCPRCGSDRWVSVSLDEGWTRRAQCVPCGQVHAPLGPGWRAGG